MQLLLFNIIVLMYMTFLKGILVSLLSISVSSCNFGPQPDKVIKITLEFDSNQQSDIETNAIVEVLKKRISKVSRDFNVEKVTNGHQIAINLKTHHDSERIKNLVTNQGRLDFYETYQMEEMMSFMMNVNDILKKDKEDENPLFDLVKSQGYEGGSVLFNVSEKDTALVRTYLSVKGAESSLPAQRRFVKFLWGRKEKGIEELPLYALKLNKQVKPALTGKVINQARQEFDQLARPTVTIVMNEEGARVWEDLTGRAFQERFQIAIVINDLVYSAPGVMSGPIIGGMSQITGNFTVEEAQDFAAVLESGSIPMMTVVNMDVEKLK